MLIPKVENRIRQYLVFLERLKYRPVAGLELEVMETEETHRTPPEKGPWKRIEVPYAYGREWTYFWFRGTVPIPESAAGREVFLRLAPNADSLVFLDGRPVGAVNPYHDVIRIAESAKSGKVYQFHMESYAGHKYPGSHPLMRESVILTLGVHIDGYPNHFTTAEVVVKNPELYELFYDVLNLFEVAQQLDENSLRRSKLLSGLYEALSLVELNASGDRLVSQAQEAGRRLAPLLAAKNGDTAPEALLVGHAHIDHAWLWPISETEHKAARTFANMARYAEEFPEFIFIQSQPVQLDIVQREYPDIFKSVRAAFERGQWEPNGGMWVEADCNLTSGESLIRQFLVGKQATRRMLDYEGDTLWLPDVFGYAAALPQILAGCEIDYFVTSKINWNDTTRFPYDTFIWKGIDGTGVKTHFITSRLDGYNGKVHPRELADAWNQVQHKELQDAVIKPIGEGDGGGGTRRSDLECARRVANLEGAPKARWTKVSEALERIFANAANLPEWRGELYLELHRGTYTTQAKTKRYNRKLEFALRDCELLYSLLAVLPRHPGATPPAYPRVELEANWKKVLTNQFHDIIPGSSINRVYRDAEAWYRQVEESLGALVATARSAIASHLRGPHQEGSGDAANHGVAVFNALSWERESLVSLPWSEDYRAGRDLVSDRNRHPVQVTRDIDDNPAAFGAIEVPATGATACRVIAAGPAENPFRGDERRLETPFYRVEFDEGGRISSLTDKSDGRQLVREGELLNRLQSAVDVPVLWDAWDIDADWVNNLVDEDRLEASEIISAGPLFHQVRRTYRIGEASKLVQDTIFSAIDRRIDFVTKIDWHESHRLLKVAFPVRVFANQVRCEVQYGHVVRNTHKNLPTDRAQFEICSHKWMCVEEAGHGAALLNDCKYGCDVQGSMMRLTLLRSPKAPDENADMGTHYLTYSLLPYTGGFANAGVVRSAYELNSPLAAIDADFAEGDGATSLVGLNVDNPNVIVEAIKVPEESSPDDVRALIVRLYESSGGEQTAELTTPFAIASVTETNMLERGGAARDHRERSVGLQMKPFEIKTLRIEIRS